MKKFPVTVFGLATTTSPDLHRSRADTAQENIVAAGFGIFGVDGDRVLKPDEPRAVAFGQVELTSQLPTGTWFEALKSLSC